MKVYFFSYKLFDPSTNKFLIGGVQTYIRDLCLICKQEKFEVALIQVSDSDDFQTNHEGIKIINQKAPYKSLRRSYQKCFNEIYSRLNASDTKFVIATDQMDIKSDAENVITIQHGIAFDIPGNLIEGFWGKSPFLQSINKWIRCYKNVRRLSNTKRVVCVDYNYYNWVRTLSTIQNEDSVKIIPNYASSCIAEEELKQKLSHSSHKRIVFARRFVDYRGTMLFANVIKRLIEEHIDVDVTFAGAGPLLEKTKKMFSGDENVRFTSFVSSESVAFHRQYDIAVVPTIFSEGTSLSLLEAMAAGCFPIATHVGGMTNIILDNYNGRLIAPTEQSLYQCLRDVLSMSHDDFSRVIRHAHDTSINAFSFSLWSERWLKVILS